MKTKRDNIAHICNLILMAIRDNDFDIEEKRVIIKIATRLGIGPSELNQAIEEGNLELNIPDSIDKRIEQLNDLVTVMVSDDVVHEEELKHLSRFLKLYGFEEKLTLNTTPIDTKYILSQKSYNTFLEKFRKRTGDKLSQIIVDKDFSIALPLYNTELSHLGPLPKTLYIFYLLQDVPVSLAELDNEKNINLLKTIYSKITDIEYSIHTDSYLCDKIKSIIDNGEGFNQNRSKIKKSLKEAMPSKDITLLNHYEISGTRSQPKKIRLDKSLIQIIPHI